MADAGNQTSSLAFAMNHRQQTLFGQPLEAVLRSGAEFSPCRTWRYTLWRIWDPALPYLAVIGLNPSTADETLDDPTIRRCIGFAKRWGYGGYYMLNCYAFRATKPADMKAAADPVGLGNDEAIARISAAAGKVLAAWGVHCDPSREADVCRLVNRPLYCLGFTKGGRPRHPLYLRGDAEPQLFFVPYAAERK